MSCDTIINDVIKLAGGILKTGTTKNINLSKVIKDELVIYVYKKNELKNSVNLPYNSECKSNTIYIDTCIKDEKSVIETDISSNDSVEQSSKSNSEEAESEVKENKLISINTASIDELTTPMVICNSSEYSEISVTAHGRISAESKMIELRR